MVRCVAIVIGMRTDKCKYCEVTATAHNYSEAQSMIVHHARKHHFDVEEMVKGWYDGWSGATQVYSALITIYTNDKRKY